MEWSTVERITAELKNRKRKNKQKKPQISYNVCARIAQLVRSLTANSALSWLNIGRPSLATPSMDRDDKPLSLDDLSRNLKEPTHFLIRVGLSPCCDLLTEGAT